MEFADILSAIDAGIGFVALILFYRVIMALVDLTSQLADGDT